MTGKRLVIRIFKGFTALAILGALGVGILLGSLWLEHTSETTLPIPTGPFAVGRTTDVWVDSVQVDKLTSHPGIKRELVTWIWYPSAAERTTGAIADYLPAPWRTAIERERGMLISKFLTRDLSLVHTHCTLDSEMSPQQRAYPVVIMRAGLAALTVEYSILAEDLASHGYVVVGFDAPYRTAVVVFPDGRIITRAPENNPETVAGPEQDNLINKLLSSWCTDMGFVLDHLKQLNASDPNGRFTGRLDMKRVGVFGHSLGGATAAQFCHDDPRCKAGIDVDGAPYGSVIHDGLHQPFMFLLSDHSDTSDADGRQIDANIRSIYSRLPPVGRLRIAIRGANHFNFSDGALLKSQIVQWMLRKLGLFGIDGSRQLAVTAHCIRNFFEVYLKESSGLEPNIQSSLYPEIELLK